MRNQIFTKIFLTVSLIFTVSLSFAQELTILHTNDMHSKLTGYGPESEYSPLVTDNDHTLGGFARLATLFADTKKKNENATLIVDAGDFLMGSLFHVSEEETGFQLNLMKTIGYDVITLGNHEFDFGPQTLSKILNTADKKGGFPQIVASNIIFDLKSPLDDDLERLTKENGITTVSIIEKAGLKIAVFGLMGIDAVSVAPASKPVSFSNYIKSAEMTVKFISQNLKPDLIICLSHSGIYPSEDGKSYIGEDIELAEKVSGIDIIISGHTHIKSPQPIKINNTYIVQTGSYAYNLGEIKLKFENGAIKSFDFQLIPVDDKIKGDEHINKLITEQISYINQNYLSKAGIDYNSKVGQTNFDLKNNYSNIKEGNIGPFVADADKYYVQKSGIDVDFSLVASGTIREDLLKGEKGIITVPDIFRVMSLGKGLDDIPGYPLAKIYLTGKELKKLSEVIITARKTGGDSYLFTSGIKIYADLEKMMLRKVQKVELNGKEIDISKKNDQLYSLAANKYLLSFIGRIKKMTYGLVKIVPKDENGNPVIDMTKQYIDIDPNKPGIQEAKEWIALIEYMKSFEKGDQNLPVIPDTYKKGDESLVIIE